LYDHLNGNPILPLVDVFIQIFHRPNGSTHVDIDMGFELLDKIRVIWYDPPVVHDHAVLLHTSAVVSPTIYRVRVLWQGSFLGELVGEAFGAHPLFVHARFGESK